MGRTSKPSLGQEGREEDTSTASGRSEAKRPRGRRHGGKGGWSAWDGGVMWDRAGGRAGFLIPASLGSHGDLLVVGEQDGAQSV